MRLVNGGRMGKLEINFGGLIGLAIVYYLLTGTLPFINTAPDVVMDNHTIGQKFNGSIDNIKIWDKELSQEEIKLLMEYSVPGEWAHMVLSYDGKNVTTYINGEPVDSKPTEKKEKYSYAMWAKGDEIIEIQKVENKWNSSRTNYWKSRMKKTLESFSQ